MPGAGLLYAHAGAPPAPHDLPHAWNLDPVILSALALLALLYARGVQRLWRRAGRGRGVAIRQVVAFGTAIATLVVALVSPLESASEALLAAHMLQHLLLILVAPLLLTLSAPALTLLFSLPSGGRRMLADGWRHAALARSWSRRLTSPVVVWVAQALALWVWHLPVLYQTALSSNLAHALEHASFYGSALLFWWVLLRPDTHQRLDRAVAVLFLFSAGLQSGMLGALMTFARQPWYPAYGAGAAAWSLTPLEDQQLAGLMMWIPGGTVYVLAALLFLGSCLRSADREAAREANLRLAG